MKPKFLLAIFTLIFAVSIQWAQEQKSAEQKPSGAPAAEGQAPVVPHGFQITPEQAARKNPLRFSEITVERGKRIYATQCAMCHGDKGDGKGEMVEEMKIHPPDFTRPETLSKRTDGELFTIIQLGDETMPGQGGRMKDIHKWEVVNYLRSLSGKTPLKSTEEELQQNTLVVKDKD